MEAFCAFDKPLLAAVRGFGIGGGATILLHRDVVYVGQSVRLRFPFANLGLVTEFAASYLMPVVLGLQQASELLFTAEWVDAETGLCKPALPRPYSLTMKCCRRPKKRHEKLPGGLYLLEF